jgi:hypothetical protein
MPLRPLAALCRYLLALALVGAPALADTPDWGSAPVAELPFGWHQTNRTKAPPQHDPARPDAADGDDPDPVALPAAKAAPAPTETPLAALGATIVAAPLSHWPCAGPSTGPPRS